MPRPAVPRAAVWSAVALAAAALFALGCGKTMTEDDCRKVAENMREAWEAESRKAAPKEPEDAEKASGVLRSEGERLAAEWAAECKKELQGRRVDQGEMDCLLRAKTLEQMSKCAEL